MRLLISFELTSIHHNQFIQVHFPPLSFLWAILAEYWRRVVKKFWLLLLIPRHFLKLFFSRCNHIVISRCKSTFFSLILLGNTLPLCHGAWTIKEYQSTVHVNRELCKSHKKYAEVEWKVEKKKNLWRFLVWLKWVHKVSMARNLCCDWNEKQERAREKK